MARIIGLTGQTGAGKTTVSDVLRRSGLDVINCDLISRQVTQAGSPCLLKLTKHFGKKILNDDQSLNRKLLASIVFSNAAELRVLESIIYTYIKAEIQHRINTICMGNTNGIVLDAPTLFESGVDSMCSEIIAVIAPKKLRRDRIMERDGLDEMAAEARIASQHDDEFYTKRSQHVLCNDGDRRRLVAKAEQLAQLLLQNPK
ncbi:dephospho-CoA kinase [Hydrogenoanaerobacterium sp.]|uniref:dephospho-CoA kinase n=1 Tax=Hydrogenoanaerobacterium sp. TaxID=2953763 RepID=UPI00289806C8|nr:dephospho-CoA kinase [Hydrogenoanaerobacterium sp.]